MAVNAMGEYNFEARDKIENFHGALVVYARWERHLLFAAPLSWPLPPDLPFGVFVGGPLGQDFAQHPDWAKIDWDNVVWTKNGKPFTPDFDKTIADNGVGHKDMLSFSTPGLDGIEGMGI